MAVLNTADKIYLNQGGEIKEVLKAYLVNPAYPDGYLLYPSSYQFHPQYQAVIDRAILEGFTLPPEANLIAEDELIRALIIEGTYWNTRDSFQLFRLGNSAYQNFSRIDRKNPNGDLATDHGGTVFTADGHKGNGVNAYRNTKFNPSNATYMTIDSIGVTHIVINNYSSGGGFLTGINQSSPNRRLSFFPKRNSASNMAMIASNDFENVENYQLNNDVSAFINYGRNVSNKYIFSNDLISQFTIAAVSPIVSLNYYINATNSNGTPAFFCDGTIGLSSFGSAVSQSQHNFLRAELNTFFTKIGLSII